jgi:HlyD family secretion protein
MNQKTILFMLLKNTFFGLLIVLTLSCNKNNNLSDAYGNFEAVQVTVSAETQGKILTMNVEEGTEPDSGQVVAIIDTTDFYLKKLQLQSQIGAVGVKKSNITGQIEVQIQQKNNLVIEKNRIVKLIAQKAATQKQLDDVEGAIELIDKQIASTKTQNPGVTEEIAVIQRQIDQLNESIRKCYIQNPLKGTVLSKYAETGEIALPGRALYKIADLSVMELKVYVSGDQLAQVKTGHKAEVIIDDQTGADRKLTGTVSWVSPKAEFTPKIIQTKEERVNLVYAVKIRVPNDGSLKIAMPAEVNF